MTESLPTISWEQPVDTTALDPNDGEVRSESQRRWKNQDLVVSPGEAADGDPLGVVLHRICQAGLKQTIIGGVLLNVKPPNRKPPTLEERQTELTRQVRLSIMARRNGAVYGTDPQFTPSARTLLLDFPELWRTDWMAIHLPRTRLVNSFYADGDQRAAWGNLHRLADPYGGQTPIVKSGWFMSYVSLSLPHTLPTMIVEPEVSASGFMGMRGTGDTVKVPVSDGFDVRFSVFAHKDARDVVADLLPEIVQAGLIRLAPTARIILGGRSLRFDWYGACDFTQPEVWNDIWALRRFVANIWYSRLGEYAGQYVNLSSPTPPHHPERPVETPGDDPHDVAAGGLIPLAPATAHNQVAERPVAPGLLDGASEQSASPRRIGEPAMTPDSAGHQAVVPAGSPGALSLTRPQSLSLRRRGVPLLGGAIAGWIVLAEVVGMLGANGVLASGLVAPILLGLVALGVLGIVAFGVNSARRVKKAKRANPAPDLR